MSRVEPLAEASFHPNLRWYQLLQAVGVLVATVVGIVVLPLWLPFGWSWSRRYYEGMECVLGERSLAISYGVWFRTEKTIPLEQIQDVSVRHGPLLDWLGLTKLKVETAGQGGSQQAAGNLVGVVDAVAFRDRVLEQRQRLSDREAGSGEAAVPSADRPDAAPARGGDVTALLSEIRDAVVRIEQRMEE